MSRFAPKPQGRSAALKRWGIAGTERLRKAFAAHVATYACHQAACDALGMALGQLRAILGGEAFITVGVAEKLAARIGKTADELADLAPDRFCVTAPDGTCVSADMRCMHNRRDK